VLCLSALASCSGDVIVVAREVSTDVAPIESLPPPSLDAGPSPVLVIEPAVPDASAEEPAPDAAIDDEPAPDDDEPGRDFDND
jgi:hypothetical protein